MVRYRLDDLGWFQFEQLIQSLLKARCGLGVESWGGRHDFGRDAYCANSLSFPDIDHPSEGPFLFHVQFVHEANAAGAKPEVMLIDSIRTECSRIIERMAATSAPATPPDIRILLQAARGEAFWDRLKHYVVITNAPVTGLVREKIEVLIHEVVPKIQVHTLGGSDVCDLLDDNPNLRRAFPQLLSLRDLDELLEGVVDRDILNKSRIVIEAAKEVCDTFVPTAAYQQSWDVLRKHHFVVLEGPPEMGKTAIARMICLAQVA
jgi:hypothetical protein